VLVNLRDLGLHGWESLGGFLVLRVVRVDDLYRVLLITHNGLPELVLRYSMLLPLPHRYVSPFHHLLSLPLLPLNAWWYTKLRCILQLF
jgi:hypothetical protein